MRELHEKDFDLFTRGLLQNRKKQFGVNKMSSTLTKMEDSFNSILSYTRNIIKLTPKGVANQEKTPVQQLVPSQPVVNTDSLIGQLTLLDKQIKLLTQKLGGLDLSAQRQSDIDIDIMKTRKRIKGGKIPKSLKVLGTIGVGLDVYDRYSEDQSFGQIATGVGSSLVGSMVGGRAGAALGSSAGPIGGIVGSVIGSTVGYLGGGYVGDKLYNTFATKTASTVDKAIANKNLADGKINDNEPSAQFASYLKATTDMVSKIVPGVGIAQSIMQAGSDFGSGYSEGFDNVETMSSNEAVNKAMAFFQSKGWTKEQAAGIVGNLQVESGNFSSDVISGKKKGDSGRAVGVAQWHPDRQAKFRGLFGRPLVGSSLQQQLEFIQWELSNNEKRAGNALRGTRSAEDAASIIDQLYERSSGEHRRQRMANARRLIKDDSWAQQAGNIVGQGASSIRDRVVGGKFIHPVNPATLGSRFGMRWGRMHKGQDYPVPMGTPVVAANSGVVTFAGAQSGYGLLVKIQHSDGSETRYAHLSRILVRQGSSVTLGQSIGLVGSTGRSTGPHLHFEILKGGRQVDPLTMIGGGGTRVPDHVADRGTEPDVAKRQPANGKGVSTGDFLKEQARSQSANKGSILIVNKKSSATPRISSKGAERSKSGGTANPAVQYQRYFTN